MKKFFLCGFLMLSLLASTALAGDNQRNFITIFQVTDYNSKIAGGVEYLFNKVLKPQDLLTVFSPVKPYSFSPANRQKYPLKKLIEQTKNVLKRDITQGTSSYNQVLQNMTQIVLDISGNWGPVVSGGGMGGAGNINNLKQQLVAYRQMLTDMRNMRKISEKLFMDLANKVFKKLKGKNYLNIFYQKEFRLIPDRETMEALLANRNIRFDVIEAFEEERGDEFIDVEKVSQALKASSVIVNFFYIQKQTIRRSGMQSKEFSGDVYNVLSKIANATGGVVIATSKPAAALKKTFGGK